MKKTTVNLWLAAGASLIAFNALAQTPSSDAMASPMASPDTSASSSPHADRSAGRTIEDKTITTKITAKFLADADIKSRDLKVRTYKGVVHLSGHTATQDLADHAVDVAKGVDGVTDVKSTIHVKAAQ